MKLIAEPRTVAERIVNAVVADIYGRSGGDGWWDSIESDVLEQEVLPQLVEVVRVELEGGARHG